ncbi:MAG: HAD family hydrolase [Mariniblastus sp.]
MLKNDFDMIIFDCDGTLVDSEPITVKVLVDYVAEFGLTIDYDEALSMFVGRDMPGIVELLETRIGKSLPDHFCTEFRERQSKGLRRDLQPIDGAANLLDAITKNFCIASNAPQYKIGINLEVTGLNKYFQPETTFSAYDINVWKPQPDLFLHAAEKMQVAPERCVVIEDSIMGVEAGLAAGMQVIGYADDLDSKPTDSVPFVDSLSDLVPILA